MTNASAPSANSHICSACALQPFLARRHPYMRLRKFLAPVVRVLPISERQSNGRPLVMQKQRLILSFSVCVTLVLVGLLLILSGPLLRSQVLQHATS